MIKEFLGYTAKTYKLILPVYIFFVVCILGVNMYEINLIGENEIYIFTKEMLSTVWRFETVLFTPLSVYFLYKYKEIKLKHTNLFVLYHILQLVLFLSNMFPSSFMGLFPFIIVPINFVYLKYLCIDIGYYNKNHIRAIVVFYVLEELFWFIRIIVAFVGVGSTFGPRCGECICTMIEIILLKKLFEKLYFTYCNSLK